MPKLQDIPSLPGDAADLLESVGYLDAEDLEDANIEELHAELIKANSKLHILPNDPTEENVRNWQETLADILADTSPDIEVEDEPDSVEEESLEADQVHHFDVPAENANFEDDPQVIEMLEISPEAIALPPALIKRHKLAVADIPEGVLLTDCNGEVEINVQTRARTANAQRRAAEARRTGLINSRIRRLDQADSEGPRVKPLERGAPGDKVTVSEGLNEGKDPNSRNFVRGVLHSDPLSVRVAAFFALLVQLSLITALIAIPWLLIHEYRSGNSMFWWVVGISSTLLISALCYAFWGISARCRICGQRQFSPKKCLKNKKAHHIKFIGYILPTAFHALFFKWFYCTYCGTAVRLKK